ncbi:MAG: oxygen-independent coproporphyrinogen III oxidase [SAR324 cluster bacterium]|nr:oxygen-independent coproporphyrinogen III oxidase [SAR324 cluster bacterium]
MQTVLTDYKEVTPEIIQRYDRSGPRYTSYPTVPIWDKGEFYSEDYVEFLEREGQSDKSLSLYIHLPFCKRLCTFCGCNKFITNNQDVVEQYLTTVQTELKMISQYMGPRKTVKQLHLGGGTPTHLSVSQLQKLIATVHEYFDVDFSGEIAFEAHPKVTRETHLKALYNLGFRRVSFGVQDIDSQVQKAINRDQTLEQTQKTFYSAREIGYTSINIDLVYGLPKQSVATFTRTMEEVNAMRPDRLAIYSFAYIPEMFRTHKKAIKEQDLPTPKDKIAIYIESIRFFTEAGYEMIGMDHYAGQTDELAVAQANHTLHRNFMGYTTLKGLSQIGVGVSSISDFGDGYFQNDKELSIYMEQIQQQRFPVVRRKVLDKDDVLRRELIESLMCHYYLPIQQFETRYEIKFHEYFSGEMESLKILEQEGLLSMDNHEIRLTKLGTLFMRNVAMVFDRYLHDKSRIFHFSRTV